jgi:hypothetical protein
LVGAAIIAAYAIQHVQAVQPLPLSDHATAALASELSPLAGTVASEPLPTDRPESSR